MKLDNGVLTLDPFAFEMPQGRLSGEARIDARLNVPTVHIDVRIKDIQLDQLKGKEPGRVGAARGCDAGSRWSSTEPVTRFTR